MNEKSYRLLVGQHRRFPAALHALIDGEDVEILRSREFEGRWSPLEIVAHLRDEEVEDFRARARAAVEGREVEQGIDPEGWVTARRYNELDPGAVLRDLERERADSCRWLEGLSLEDLESAVEHPKLGTFRAGDFIAAWRMHDLLHLGQLATALTVITACHLEGWKVEYAGDIPFGAPREPLP